MAKREMLMRIRELTHEGHDAIELIYFAYRRLGTMRNDSASNDTGDTGRRPMSRASSSDGEMAMPAT